MKIKTNNSSIWPYVIAGSAVGGAVGFLLASESGRKIRHSITHPDEFADNLDDARDFIESKARIVTDRVHVVLNKAKYGIQEGERAYREAGENFQSKVHDFQGKHGNITSGVHKAVDNMNRTAVNLENSILDPIIEMGALYTGIERAIRALFGKGGHRTENPSPLFRNTRVMGD
jgi:gas vesicle protein